MKKISLKKALSMLITAMLILSSLAFTFSAFGKTQTLILNTKMTETIDGVDDVAQFIFVPDESGTYSFLSYNVPASEAYLLIREVNSETNQKEYVQLAYSCSDPDYQENGHNSRQFRLTYHLEKGVTYYFWAGWYLSENRTDGTMTVMLRCDQYDSNIEKITISCPASLDAYTDGMWMTDLEGSKYYHYNTTRLEANMTVTIHFNDGEQISATGQEEINGYRIIYLHSQSTNHWYPQSDENYTENTFTVKVLDKTASMDVPINIGARFAVKGIVTDMLGNPIENAEIRNTQGSVVYTDFNGVFCFYTVPGDYSMTVCSDNSLDRKFRLVVSALADDNDFTSVPIQLCDYEYVKDGIINAK
ncbi:MAG: hypothetical protein ACI4RR_07205, partial [Eubacterium sp.]